MLLGEELVLVLLDEEKGTWRIRPRTVARAVRLALVLELLARGAVVIGEDGTVREGMTGAAGGDELLERVARTVPGRSVEEAVRPWQTEVPTLLRRLREAGELRRSPVRRRRHLADHSRHRDQVLERLRAALQLGSRPDRHTAQLVAILHELKQVKRLFPGPDVTTMTSRAGTLTAELRDQGLYVRTGLLSRGLDAKDARYDLTREGLPGLVEGAHRLARLPGRAAWKILDTITI